MDPSAESYEAHVELLRDWTETEEGLPPGLSAELGFYLGLLGHTADAEAWFATEVANYPEAAGFVAALRAIALEEAGAEQKVEE